MSPADLLELAIVARFYRANLEARAIVHHQRHETKLAQLLAQGSVAAGEVADELAARAMFGRAVAGVRA